MPSYRLDLKSPAGVRFASVTDFEQIACYTGVNVPGSMAVLLDGDHSAISSLEDKSQVELWRRDRENDIDWYMHFGGIYRAQRWDQPAEVIFKLTAQGYLSMLGWRIVAWRANTTDRSRYLSEKAETILKTMVDYNACANATIANGREREGAITGITIQTDGANGNTLDWYCAWDNLLTSLHDLSRIAGGDYDLVKTAAQAWQFRWYTGQLGTDRSATVTFSVGRGNMGDPMYIKDRTDEATVCIVGGQGEGDLRMIAIVTGADYHVTTNNIEVFYNGSGNESADGLADAGDTRLDELRARDEFSFVVLQTPASLFGVHYFLGDLVKVVNPFTGVAATKKIVGVTLQLEPSGDEIIDIEIEDA